MKKISLILIVLLTLSCQETKKEDTHNINNNENITIEKKDIAPVKLNTKKAAYLYHFAYECIDREYPNKPGQVLGNGSYLKEPHELHPAFYGCFDWHSSVHGHWTLVNILKEFPGFRERNAILKKLKNNITKENIQKEIAYFDDKHNKNYERTYGWAWLLKLSKSLKEWNDPEAKQLSENLQPLVELIENKFFEFLNKLNHPIRVGEHSNTAFGMSFAYDYAKKYNDKLAKLIEKKARNFYLNDKGCPISWEPGGFDFLSPCIIEADLMMKILPKDEYIKWLNSFLPNFRNNPSKYLEIAQVADRSDGKMAHLDGLNFSRAWCLYEIGKKLDNTKMTNLANKHFNASYNKMDSGEYAGAHWLASFALHALLAGK